MLQLKLFLQESIGQKGIKLSDCTISWVNWLRKKGIKVLISSSIIIIWADLKWWKQWILWLINILMQPRTISIFIGKMLLRWRKMNKNATPNDSNFAIVNMHLDHTWLSVKAWEISFQLQLQNFSATTPVMSAMM